MHLNCTSNLNNFAIYGKIYRKKRAEENRTNLGYTYIWNIYITYIYRYIHYCILYYINVQRIYIKIRYEIRKYEILFLYHFYNILIINLYGLYKILSYNHKKREILSDMICQSIGYNGNFRLLIFMLFTLDNLYITR